MNPYNVLLKPVLSEKSLAHRDNHNKYQFIVDLKSTKQDIKVAVEKLFGVDVCKVHTSILRGKQKRRGQQTYLSHNRKKASVTLKDAQKITLFDDH